MDFVSIVQIAGSLLQQGPLLSFHPPAFAPACEKTCDSLFQPARKVMWRWSNDRGCGGDARRRSGCYLKLCWRLGLGLRAAVLGFSITPPWLARP